MPATFARLLPRPEGRDAWTNILSLLALPLLAFLVFAVIKGRTYRLEIPVLADRPALLGVEAGFEGSPGDEQGPAPARVVPSNRPQTIAFEFPICRLNQLVLHAKAAAGVRLGGAVFHSALDEFLGLDKSAATFSPADYRLPTAAAGLPPSQGGFRALASIPGTEEAALALPLTTPLALTFNWRGFCLALGLAGAEYLLLAAAALLAWRRLRAWEPSRHRIDSAGAAGDRIWRESVGAARRHPAAAIWVAAAFGVAVSCYPVIFCGKSFVSPNYGATLLYDRFPTLPGYTDASTGDAQGSDVLATLSCFVPYAIVQRHSLLVDHEFPFLDRYNQCGLPLLAQGQTMIGDPLHLLMLLAGANAWAWDARFLFSRLLFAAGVGLLVRLTTRQTALALLLAFASCFLGFFQFRLNHPTYFCLCYAPWILYAWLHLPAVGRWREAAPWIGLLLLADWMEINAGPVKEAYLLTISLNLCGVLVLLLFAQQPWHRRWRVLGLALWCEAALSLVSNPFWVTMLDLLAHGWNVYQTPRLWQIQPSLLLGFFDDIFYRQFEAGERVFEPGTNFVVLLGLAFAASYAKTLLRNRVFLGVGVGALTAFAMAFGVVPPAMIKEIPFLGNVLHIDDVFSTILIVPAFVLAGIGFAECRRRFNDRDWLLDFVAAVGVLVFLFAIFLGTTQAAQRSAIHNLDLDHEVTKSFFFWCDAGALSLAFVALPLLARQLARPDGRARWSLAPWFVLCLATLLWRQGQQLHFAPGLDRYVSRPQVRVDFSAKSPAVDYLHRGLPEPGRVLGLQNNLFPGDSGIFGLEGISGSDALMVAAYHRLLAAQLHLDWGWRPVIDKGTLPEFKATADMLNVRYYLGAPGGREIDLPGVSRVAKLDLDVFESRDVWPRAFYTDVLSTFHGRDDFLGEVKRNDGHPFAVRYADMPGTSLPAGVNALSTDQAARVVVPATNYRLTDNSTTFDVHAPGPGVVALMEVYDGANKQVTVNGHPSAHFPVNAAFEGIYVDHAGTYTVSVRAWPRYFTAGLYVSALGLLLLLGTAAMIYWPARSPLPQPAQRHATAMAVLQ